MTIAPRDPFSDVVDQKRKIMPDWYSWFNELTRVANSAGGGSSGNFVFLSSFITGSGDQTANINAAFASLVGSSGTLVWDVVGLINTTDTIVVGANNFANNSGPTSFINILGLTSGDLGGISYRGPVDRPALLFCKNKFFTVRNLHIGNDSGLGFGTSVGIMLGGQGGGAGTGTQTLAGMFENVRIIRFATGIQAGGNFGEASEFLFNSLQFYSNDVGFNAIGFNCLDYEFHMLSLDGNRIGVSSGASDGFHVYGGSSTADTQCDFYIEGNGHCSVSNFRCENLPAGASFVGGNFGGDIVLRSCLVQASSTKYSLFGPLERISIYDCSFDSFVQITDFCSQCTMIGNNVPLDPTTQLPFIRQTDGGAGPAKFKVWNNADIVSGNAAYDFVGANRYSGSNVSPFQVLAYEPTIHTVVEHGSYTADSQATYGADYVALCRVRQLSEGPVVGSRQTISQTAVTNAVTVTGRVLHFASVPSFVVPNMVVDDVTTGGRIPFNAYVVSFTATTVTISADVTGGGVLSGDTINFWNQMGAATPGKNLRVTGTLAGTSVGVLFKRSITVNGIGGQSQQLIAATGRFYPTDVGKPIRIVGQGNNGWTDMYGNIWSYIDSTHVLFQPGPGQVDPSIGVGAGATAFIGEDEPDANFIVAGLCADASGTFWVSALATTGFTLNAAAASTANVVALIVR